MPGLLESYYYWTRARAAETPPAPPAGTYEDGVLTLSPVGYWPMDDASGNFADATGNGWTATAAGDPTYQQSGPTIATVSQYAIDFDGTGDYGTVSTNIDNSVTTTMTISLWFKVAPTAAAQALCGMYDTGDRSWRVFLGTSGTLGFYTYQTDGATLHTFTQPSGALDDGSWHHAVAWIDANGYANVTVDGGAITGQDTTLDGTWNGPTTSGLVLAATNTSGSTPMTGLLAHVAYWDSDIGSSARSSLRSGSF